MKQISLLLSFFLLTSSAHALEPGDKCDKIKVMPEGLVCWEDTTYDCNGNLRRIESLLCADAEFHREDKQLNATYRTILKSLEGPGDGTVHSDPAQRKKELIEAQKAWVSFRIADCKSQGNLNGSDWNDVFIVSCETQATKERIRVLKKRFLE